jgi:hypothetical protein
MFVKDETANTNIPASSVEEQLVHPRPFVFYRLAGVFTQLLQGCDVVYPAGPRRVSDPTLYLLKSASVKPCPMASFSCSGPRRRRSALQALRQKQSPSPSTFSIVTLTSFGTLRSRRRTRVWTSTRPAGIFVPASPPPCGRASLRSLPRCHWACAGPLVCGATEARRPASLTPTCSACGLQQRTQQTAAGSRSRIQDRLIIVLCE